MRPVDGAGHSRIHSTNREANAHCGDAMRAVEKKDV